MKKQNRRKKDRIGKKRKIALKKSIIEADEANAKANRLMQLLALAVLQTKNSDIPKINSTAPAPPHLNEIKDVNSNENESSGYINSIINSLPVELHAPGYNFLGPGTKYKDRISGKFGSSNQHPINALDAAALLHDAAYTKYNDVHHRVKADKVLRQTAKEIYSNSTNPIGERSTAYFTDKVFQLKKLFDA
jgi:hypothetical protein